MGTRRWVSAAAITGGLVAVLLTGCVDSGATPTPGATTASATPTPTASSTPSPTPTATEGPVPSPTYTEPPSKPTTPPEEPPATEASVQILNSSYDPAAGTVRVDALVSNVISSSGSCALSVVQGDQSASAQVTSTADATVTYCAEMIATLPAGASGSWTVTVVFDDGTAQGSASGEVVVS
ncbi:hypothetical protein SCB71_14880 [Herbiconiux sp. KACC 21604]|uniref:hypothetical protein n=1 Tax=unclassified Herbiconiux TaxID=2618217 RepID=UPI001490AD79|nr:hypothetical protein [Herbiconiux sp. SALV-R1]QJU54423.1 hypothetical protein HL652_12820 [Herbiconiux sp. SALV-R1]WPO85497.1 hypothetical protein SCB71_14880 [Herbiconiux sp. KACC 21604]